MYVMQAYSRLGSFMITPKHHKHWRHFKFVVTLNVSEQINLRFHICILTPRSTQLAKRIRSLHCQRKVIAKVLHIPDPHYMLSLWSITHTTVMGNWKEWKLKLKLENWNGKAEIEKLKTKPEIPSWSNAC